MQVATRRLIIVSAIALFGATAGIALGNFVARGPKISGTDELANYSAAFDMNSQAPQTDDPDRTLAAQSGPSHYNCTGCDAALYNENVGGNDMPASTEPLPPYRVEETQEAAVRRDTLPGLAPRRGSPPGSAALPVSAASPAPVGSGVAQMAAPPLPPAGGTR